MSDNPESISPKAFISYSHDTAAHKKWVADLASKLMANGIDVALDQWDIGPGDDVPKFMERSVPEADCVLMICTEAYVRKANDGKGGAGYETMIVTGELVKNLGTSKFVPIVRQENGGTTLPRSVSTRYYVDLSVGKDAEEGFKDLLHKIHKVPKIKKPALGKSPFVSVEVAEPRVADASDALSSSSPLSDTVKTYNRALDLARHGDLLEWRRLVKGVKQPLPGTLTQWRAKYEGAHGFLKADLPKMATEAAGVYAPLMALALAGVQSGSPDFLNQQSLLDDFLSPTGWNIAGSVILACIPEALVFTYQALHGAVCLDARRLSSAIALSRARIHKPHKNESTVLYQDTSLIGWPEFFETRCNQAWAYLVDLAAQWDWIRTVFGSADDYKIALAAYYMALNVQELADLMTQGSENMLGGQEPYRLVVPILFCSFPREILVRAYRLLLERPESVQAIWRSLGLKDSQMAHAWPKWIQECRQWLGKLYPYGFTHGPLIQTNLLSDLGGES